MKNRIDYGLIDFESSKILETLRIPLDMGNKDGELVCWPYLLEIISANTGMEIKVFLMAVKNNHIEIVKFFLDQVDPSCKNNQAIVEAAEHGHTDIVKLLLADPRIDPGINEGTPLLYAVAERHEEIVKLLLANPRSNPDGRNNYPILCAAERRYPEIVRLLIKDHRVSSALIKQEWYHQKETIISSAKIGCAEVPVLLALQQDPSSLYTAMIINTMESALTEALAADTIKPESINHLIETINFVNQAINEKILFNKHSPYFFREHLPDNSNGWKPHQSIP